MDRHSRVLVDPVPAVTIPLQFKQIRIVVRLALHDVSKLVPAC